MITDCTAIILAGGDSQRMGSDKANLLLGDQTLLQRATITMQRLFPASIVSVRQLRPEINLVQVCDEIPHSGPLAGLVSAMGHVTTPWVFVLACDMPFVEPGLVELLAEHRFQYQAVVPMVRGCPQPLSAFYSLSCLDTMRVHLMSGRKNSMRAILEQLKVNYLNDVELSLADPALHSFLDLDTPEDAAMINGRFGGLEITR